MNLKNKAINSVSRIIPDKPYLILKYRVKMGSNLNLKNPKKYTEKIQWLKLNDYKPEYTDMVDKYNAKSFVSGIIGEQYIIPTLGVWDSFDEIDFTNLPNQFVLKCTHDSGGVVICKDKTVLDINAAKRKIENALKNDFYYAQRERPYKYVTRRIIAEQYMEDHVVNDLRDYKIHCFNGEPKYLQVIGNRNHSNHTGNQMFYSFDWKDAGWAFGDYPPYNKDLEKPYHLELMYEIAKKLSQGLRYIRVDLYEINGDVYFGELTLYPAGGFYPYNNLFNLSADTMLGDLIQL